MVETMDSSEVPVGSIVVGFDGSPSAQGALDWAIDQAALEQRTLTIVHAIPSVAAETMAMSAYPALDVVVFLDDARAEAQSVLDRAVAHARERAPDLTVDAVLTGNDPRIVLLDLGEHAAMIVVGSRGSGPIASLLLGSVSVSVSKHAACPVVVRRASGAPASRSRIVVGVDGTALSLPAIEFAYRMASFRGSDLTVLHCYWTTAPVAAAPGAWLAPDLATDRVLVAESLAGMAEKFPDVAVEVRLVPGSAGQQLVAASPHYDLVVMGHHRLSPLNDLVSGSVAALVLEHADGDVAVVPSYALAAPASPTGG